MNWKGCGRKWSWPAFAWRYWGKPRKLRQDSRSPGRDLNPGPPEYEAGLLTTRPWRSVSIQIVTSLFNCYSGALVSSSFLDLEHYNVMKKIIKKSNHIVPLHNTGSSFISLYSLTWSRYSLLWNTNIHNRNDKSPQLKPIISFNLHMIQIILSHDDGWWRKLKCFKWQNYPDEIIFCINNSVFA
jgi:hypothetical protein